MRARALAMLAALGGAAALPSWGCSFFLDFPDEAVACALTVDPDFLEVVWHGQSATSDPGAYTTITGLARGDGALYGVGFSGGQPSDLDTLPSFSSNVAWLFRLDDTSGIELAGSINACTTVSGYTATGRIALDGEVPFVTGYAPVDAAGSATYGFDDGELVCGEGLSVEMQGSQPNSYVAWAADFPGDGKQHAVASQTGYAGGLDVAVHGSDVAMLGVARSDVFGQSHAGGPLSYFVVKLAKDTLQPGKAQFLKVDTDTTHFEGLYELHGAVEIDDEGAIWAAGMECSTDPCTTYGHAFVERAAPSLSEDVTTVAISNSDPSFAHAMTISGGALFVGGAYAKSFEIGGVSPAATGSATDFDSFVANIDPTTKQATWVWPLDSIDQVSDYYDAVVDMVVVPDEGCGGSVYVLGCIVTKGDASQDCMHEEPGKHAYVARLDLASGTRLYFKELSPDDTEAMMLLPTALAGDASALFAAFDVRGTMTPWNFSSDAAGFHDTAVVKLGSTF
ncbi:MAG: hypothetical protein U0271_01505 [Polyangiaceae bacterium]